MIFATIFIDLVCDIVHARYSAYMLLFFLSLKHYSWLIILWLTSALLEGQGFIICIYVVTCFHFICFTLQVNFCYFEAGENKQALVKLVACERWVSMKHYRFCCPCHCFLMNPYPLVKWLISIINHLMMKLSIGIINVYNKLWVIQISILLFYTEFLCLHSTIFLLDTGSPSYLSNAWSSFGYCI